MPVYNYLAVQPDGKEKKGKLEAPNQEVARMILRSDGKIPLTIEEPNLLSKDINLSIGSGVKARDLGVFCRQFESILKAGVTIINALQMLGDQTGNKIFRTAIREVQTSVEKGETLAGAMGEQGKIFPEILINMVRAGEASGSLEVAFARMATHFEKDAKLKGSIAKAMIYPIILLLAVVGVVGVMMVLIIPSFTSNFSEMGISLPGITLAVMGISGFLQKYWYVVFLVIGGIVLGIRQLKKTDAGAVMIGRIALKLPIVGTLTIKTSCARFTRTLSTLLAAGISLMDAVEIISKIMTNRIVKNVMETALEEIKRGIALSQPLEYSGIFPSMVYHMVKIGEETGNMEEMLDTIADYYEEEVEQTTAALTAAMEPLIIIVMAGIVVPLILAIMLPMLSIYSGADSM